MNENFMRLKWFKKCRVLQLILKLQFWIQQSIALPARQKAGCINGFLVYIHAFSGLMSMNSCYMFCRVLKLILCPSKTQLSFQASHVPSSTDNNELSVCKKVQMATQTNVQTDFYLNMVDLGSCYQCIYCIMV